MRVLPPTNTISWISLFCRPASSKHRGEWKEKSQMLDLCTRLDIAVGIARALECLHTNADPPVIHRDVKPSNILLDKALTAKVVHIDISRVSVCLQLMSPETQLELQGMHIPLF